MIEITQLSEHRHIEILRDESGNAIEAIPGQVEYSVVFTSGGHSAQASLDESSYLSVTQALQSFEV